MYILEAYYYVVYANSSNLVKQLLVGNCMHIYWTKQQKEILDMQNLYFGWRHKKGFFISLL